MRICHIITTLVYGGAEKLLVNTVNLHAQHHEVHVIYLKGEPTVVHEFVDTISLHRISLSSRSVSDLRQLFEHIQPDIIHTHLGHADFIGLWAAQGLPIPTFCTMHNIWFKWDWRDHLYFLGYRILLNYIVPDCHVVGISQSVSEHVQKRLGVPAERVSTIYNAVPEVDVPYSRQELRSKLNIPPEAFCILFIGRLRIQKSVDTLLHAVSKIRLLIPDLSVMIVGEGQGYEEDRLKNLSRDLGLDEIIRFCGTTGTPEYFFAAADLFVLPSVFEGLGLVILEAFRASLPVIATNIEGPKELIQDGENGLLFEPRNVEQLVDHILRLYTDMELRHQLGKNGYTSFRNKFSMAKYADSLEKLYLGQHPV